MPKLDRPKDSRTVRMFIWFHPEVWELVKAESWTEWVDKHGVINEAVRQFVKARRHERALKRGCKGNWLTGEVIARGHRMTLEEALQEIERLNEENAGLMNSLMYAQEDVERLQQ